MNAKVPGNYSNINGNMKKYFQVILLKHIPAYTLTSQLRVLKALTIDVSWIERDKHKYKCQDIGICMQTLSSCLCLPARNLALESVVPGFKFQLYCDLGQKPLLASVSSSVHKW